MDEWDDAIGEMRSGEQDSRRVRQNTHEIDEKGTQEMYTHLSAVGPHACGTLPVYFETKPGDQMENTEMRIHQIHTMI